MNHICKYKGFTHAGLVRDINEDNYEVIQFFKGDDEGKQIKVTLGVVADGMGGAKAGEIASAKAVETIIEEFKNLKSLPNSKGIEDYLRTSFTIAHNQIATIAMGDSEKAGLGTTLTVLLIVHDKAHIMWIGDSRVYLYQKEASSIDSITKDKRLKLVTSDHSMIWNDVKSGKVTLDEAEHIGNSHIITQSLGSFQHIPESEYKCIHLSDDDVILMCTDGVNRHLKTEEIKEALALSTDANLTDAIDQIKNSVLEKGAEDNFTALIFNYSNKNPNPPLKKNGILDKIIGSKFEIGAGLFFCVLLILLFNSFGTDKNPQAENKRIIIENPIQEDIKEIPKEVEKDSLDSINLTHQKAVELWELMYKEINTLYDQVKGESYSNSDLDRIKFGLKTLVSEKDNRRKVINMKNRESVRIFEDTEYQFYELNEAYLKWKKENSKNEI